MRYNQDKCLNFLQNEKKKSTSGRIPIYVGDKTNCCKEPFADMGEPKHQSPTSVRFQMDQGKQRDDTPLQEQEESATDKKDLEHDNTQDVYRLEDKATKQTSSDDKPVKTKLENGKYIKTVGQTTNKGKGSMIPKSTRRFRSRQGSKKRAAALVDELSKSVEDLSRTETSHLDETPLTRASKFSKSCENLDSNTNLDKAFPQDNPEDNENKSSKTEYDQRDKYVFGIRKSKKRRDMMNAMDTNNVVVSKKTETEEKRNNNNEKEEKSKQKHACVEINKNMEAHVDISESDPVAHDSQSTQQHEKNDENQSDVDNKTSTQGEGKKTQQQNESQSQQNESQLQQNESQSQHNESQSQHNESQSQHNESQSPRRGKKRITQDKRLKQLNTQLSDHEHKMLAEESDAIIAEIKSRKKVGRKRDDVPMTAIKVDMDEQEGDTSNDNSAVQKRSAENKGSTVKEKTHAKKNDDGGSEIKKQRTPMIYNEIKMNTVTKELLGKSIDDMERFNKSLSRRQSDNSTGDHSPHKGNDDISRSEEVPDDPDDINVISTASVSKGRRRLFPKLNLSLNFDDSHQSSPLNSSNGILEMSSGLEANNNTTSSTYNFHISLDESQELSQSADLIKNKIFNDKDEWDLSQTSASVRKNEREGTKSTPSPHTLISRRDVNKAINQAMELDTEKTHQRQDNLVRRDTPKNGDVLSQSVNSVNSDRSGASSSCSLLYNKEMGLICKKCFDTSCCHMDQVDGLESFTPENSTPKESKPFLLKQQESIKLSEIDQSKSVLNKYRENLFDYGERRPTHDSRVSAGNIRNINGKNIHLSEPYSSTGNDTYNSRDRLQDSMPFTRHSKANYPAEFLEKYNPELYYNNNTRPPYNSYHNPRPYDSPGRSDSHDEDYQSKFAKIQDNRRTLNHLLRNTPSSSTISQDEDGGSTGRSTNALIPPPDSRLPTTDSTPTNEPETPKTSRRSNSIIAASDLETVFEVDERTTPITPKSSTGMSSYIAKSEQLFESSEESNDEHLASPALPQYDKKDQILQLLDQARSILNLKKRKTSQDCYINTDKIYNRNMMKANSAISTGTISPKKKPKTASPPVDRLDSMLPDENIEKSKSAPGLLDRRTRNTIDSEGIGTDQKIERKNYGGDLDVPLNMDLWVNVSANLPENSKRDNQKRSDKNYLKSSSSFVLNSTESDKDRVSAQNSTPSPGDSGIELNNSNTNLYSSTGIDSKRDVKTLSKDKTLISNTEAAVNSTQQRNTSHTKDTTKFSILNPRILHSTQQPSGDRYKDGTIPQRPLSEKKKTDNGMDSTRHQSEKPKFEDDDRYMNSSANYQRQYIEKSNVDNGNTHNEPSLYDGNTHNEPSLYQRQLPQRATIDNGSKFNDFERHQRHLSDRTNMENGDRYTNSPRLQRRISDKTNVDVDDRYTNSPRLQRRISDKTNTDIDDRYKNSTVYQRQLSNRTALNNSDRYKDTPRIPQGFPKESPLQRQLSDRTNFENGSIQHPYKPQLLSSLRRPFPPSRRASDITDQPNYSEQGGFTESETWPRNYNENSINVYKFDETLSGEALNSSLNQRSDIYPAVSSPYSRNYSKSLPSIPSHNRYRTMSEPLQSQNSYRLSNHIISHQQVDRSERIPSIDSHRRDFIDYSPSNHRPRYM